MQVVILCGGRGTRAYPYTDYLPKPMMPIGNQPILLHVMRLFAAQGHKEFILSVGWRKEIILDYFDRKSLDFDVRFVDTGLDTDTGGRISGCKHLLRDPFFATYADGLSDVPLDKLVDFHKSRGGWVTITTVPLRSQYGTVHFDAAGKVDAFREKPVLREHWINAGFFVMNKAVFDNGDGKNLERDVFPALARKGKLFAYQHDGFFKSMDTYKDQQELEPMFADRSIPGLAPSQVKIEPPAPGTT
jgi:glucose-1-phosphate cytidylyltransferase